MIDAATLRRRVRDPLWIVGLVIAIEVSFFLWLVLSAISTGSPVRTIQTGEVDGGWTQIGNETRLQYVDLPDGVRCYRMRYSSNLSCVREPV